MDDLNLNMLSPLDLVTDYVNFTFNPETEMNQLGLSGLRNDAFDITLFSNDEIQEIQTVTGINNQEEEVMNDTANS